MPRPSEIEEEIARTLVEHDHDYDSDCGLDFGCACGAIDEYKSGAEHTDHLTEVLSPLLNRVRAEAWRQGHAAGRDYQGDGWNCDAHDPEGDNPYIEQNSEGN